VHQNADVYVMNDVFTRSILQKNKINHHCVKAMSSKK